MIKEIKIENFKSIQSLNLELGRLNVFIGANGSGKSNILEGIVFGAATIVGRDENIFLSARGVRITEPNLMVPLFEAISELTTFLFTNHLGETLKYMLNPTSKEWRGTVPEESSILLEHDFVKKSKMLDDNIFMFDGKQFKKNERLSDEALATYKNYNEFQPERIKRFLSESGLLSFMIFAPENYFLRRFEEETQIKPLGIRGEGLFKLISEFEEKKPEYLIRINEHLQLLEWFEGFEIPNNLRYTEKRIKIKDKFLVDSLHYIDQRSANEGFLYLLFYLTLFISDDTPKFFAIDNIDNAMNPKLGSELIRILSKLAKEHDKQVILTTHNPSVLDGLDLSDDEQRLFVISRNKSGHTQAIRVPHRESDERLSTRFIRGSIGGLPKNF
jgi:AAA15 family ATPase/GTPase